MEDRPLEWRRMDDPPKGETGRWTERVIVWTSWGNILRASYLHGSNGGAWQVPSSLNEKEVMELWIKSPQ